MCRWVDGQINILARCVVNGDEGRWVDNGILEALHGLLTLFLPIKDHTLTHEINQGMGDGGIVADPNPHEASSPKKCLDVSECFAGGPVPDVRDLWIIRDAAFVVALVAKNDNLWYCHEQFLGRNSGTSAAEVVENAVEVEEMFPDESSYIMVLRDHLILPTIDLILCHGPLDAAVIHIWPGDMGDLGFQ
jgi:hypothetical protein